MRKLFPITMALVIVVTLIACTNDSTEMPTDQYARKVLKSNLFAIDAQLSPYDSIGRLHNILLDAYFAQNHADTTIQQINDSIDILMQYGGSTNAFGSQSCAAIASEILLDPIASFEAAVPDSGLSSAAVSSFASLLTTLSTSSKADYEYTITSYAQSIVDNSTLSDRDKEVLSTTSSLAMYSYYYGKERKDKDWETSVGNVVAAFRGALSGSQPAIRLTLVTGIAQYSSKE